MSYELGKMIARIDEELDLIEQREGPLAVFDATYARMKKKRRLLQRIMRKFQKIERRMGIGV